MEYIRIKSKDSQKAVKIAHVPKRKSSSPTYTPLPILNFLIKVGYRYYLLPSARVIPLPHKGTIFRL